MAFHSMTGIASVEGGDATCAWVWSARSVNGRGLEIRCRVPSGLERLEAVAREHAARLMSRGHLQLTLSLEFDDSRQVTVDHGLLDRLATLVEKRTGALDAPAFATLLTASGVISSPRGAGAGTAGVYDDLAAGLGGVLERLAAERLREGADLERIIGRLLDDIDGHVETAGREAHGEPGRIHRALAEKVRDLAAGDVLDRERLAQEVALMASRADVREEIDRLRAHASAARDLLAGDGCPGRRLGFLAQEMLREANTLCSKSQSAALTAAGLDLKVAVDRLREQAQNVE